MKEIVSKNCVCFTEKSVNTLFNKNNSNTQNLETFFFYQRSEINHFAKFGSIRCWHTNHVTKILWMYMGQCISIL